MAQRVQVRLIDDLTGNEAQETVRFALDGTKYEIDLTTANADKLRSALSEYIENGRKTSSRRTSQSALRSAMADQSHPGNTQQIRQWARQNGYNPSSKGRITQSILDAYYAAIK